MKPNGCKLSQICRRRGANQRTLRRPTQQFSRGHHRRSIHSFIHSFIRPPSKSCKALLTCFLPFATVIVQIDVIRILKCDPECVKPCLKFKAKPRPTPSRKEGNGKPLLVLPRHGISHKICEISPRYVHPKHSETSGSHVMSLPPLLGSPIMPPPY